MSRSIWIAVVTASCFLVACDGDGPGDEDGGADRDATASTSDAGGSDGGGGGADSGPEDGGAGDACAGAADGTDCGSGLICISESCASSTCGDGYTDTDAGEECDDGNDVAFDGCEPTSCTFTCTDDPRCDDGRECNGAETCNLEMHVCQLGVDPDDGSACDLTGTGDGVCRGDDCVAAGCGNGVLDGTEDCDDGNGTDGDGCDTDCTFSCVDDVDCSDSDICTGEETCGSDHVCQAGTALVCEDSSPCTMDTCDPTEGCLFPLIDGDGDGFASTTLGECGDDCDDARDDVFPGAEEQCDAIDHNCNGIAVEGAPTWYVDCDEDGYATDTTGALTQCDMPAPAGGCGWTSRRPVDMSNTDCHDGNPDVHPNQTRYFGMAYTQVAGGTSFDYNCDRTETRSVPQCVSPRASCRTGIGLRCSGASGYETEDCLLGLVPPACGHSGTYSSCGLSFCSPPPCIGSSCRRSSRERQQTCR